jgi:XTP/dITP diphosphohydrolase
MPSHDCTFYVATSNPGKLRDFAAAASLYHVALLPLPGLDRIPPPAEDADSFAGNACLKAIAYSREAEGKVVLADDSGLEVDALGGAPGVYSARFAADVGFPNPRGLSKDEHNNAYLLDQLRGVPEEKRTARYKCVLALARDGAPLPHQGSGTVEGVILTAPRGNAGFGYDPLFFLPELGRTMAEISLDERLRFSHRSRALANYLRQVR